MPNEYSDVYVGVLGLSWKEKVVSNLSKAYPEKKKQWKGIFIRVYDAYASLVNAGSPIYTGTASDTSLLNRISAITGDTAADISKTLSAVSSVDKEKITLKHVGLFEKITKAPGTAAANILKPLVPFLIPAVGLVSIGAYFYFVDLKKAQMRAIARQKI